MNFKETVFMSGGANSFLSSLRKHLKGQGITLQNQIDDKFDLIFLNALTNGLNLKNSYDNYGKLESRLFIVKLATELAELIKCVPLQMAVFMVTDCRLLFLPISITRFFRANTVAMCFFQGFYGDFSVIHNGVDKSIFNDRSTKQVSLATNPIIKLLFGDETQPLVLGALTWSKDLNKGFEDYLKFDEALTNCSNVEIRFLGRKPHNIKFKNINVYRPRYKKGVAKFLKRCNGFIQMARFETCSNALIEAISCGLPIIYVDSGSSRELVEGCG